MRGASRLLLPLILSAAIMLGACSKEVKHRGALPVDTAAIIPTLGTTPVEAAGATPGQGDTLAGDSAAAPLPAEPSIVAASDSMAGDLLFHGKGRCFTCHGERGQGTPRLGPALTDSESLTGNWSLASIASVIAQGVAVPKSASVAMPAYTGMLTSRDMALIAAYVYALSHPGSTASDSGTAAGNGDTTTGAASSRVTR